VLDITSQSPFRFTTLPPLTLYVHLPWCARKCPYCDFNSHAAREAIPEARYVDALLADLDNELPRVRDRRVEAIFIGGGTPSLFSAATHCPDRPTTHRRSVLRVSPR